MREREFAKMRSLPIGFFEYTRSMFPFSVTSVVIKSFYGGFFYYYYQNTEYVVLNDPGHGGKSICRDFPPFSTPKREEHVLIEIRTFLTNCISNVYYCTEETMPHRHPTRSTQSDQSPHCSIPPSVYFLLNRCSLDRFHPQGQLQYPVEPLLTPYSTPHSQYHIIRHLPVSLGSLQSNLYQVCYSPNPTLFYP